MSTHYYERIEQGRGTPALTGDTGRIARALGLTLDERDQVCHLAELPHHPGTSGSATPTPSRAASDCKRS
jgi:hypothetical protein